MPSKSIRKQHREWAYGKTADAWYERNSRQLARSDTHTRSLQLFASYIRSGERVLEIGCANGQQIERLRKLTECQAHGIDPSRIAIAAGRAAFPALNLRRGTADKLSYADQRFDAVIFGFCLYLVDRSLLMSVVAEADRVLRDGGKLMITDFDPVQPHSRPYKHQPGVWSYKMQYPSLWLSSPVYCLAEKISFSHEQSGFVDDPDQRVASWVLIKQKAENVYPIKG